MAIAPTSIENLPLKLLRDVLAGTTAFQSWTGTASQAAALARVHYVGVDSGLDGLPPTRPFAVVSFQPEDGLSSERNATSGYVRNGRLLMMFQADIDPLQSLADQVMDFTNNTGAVMAELEQDAETQFALDGWSRLIGPLIGDENEIATESDFAMVLYEIEYRDG